MKNLLFLFLLLSFSTNIFSQNLTLPNFNQERLDLNRQGMTVLGSWAGANLITNGILLSNASGSEKAFYQMNIYWNVVNGALAGLGLLQKSKNQASMSAFQTLEEQSGTEKVFLLNTGLDVAYVMGGVYLLEKSKNSTSDQDQLKGFGQSVILQGGFLLLFDGIMYGVHRSHLKKGRVIFENLTFTGNQIGLNIRF
ncbi:MAG: hypothetical protein U5N85_08110 [Arcicella sp.]|nr:hypothetical protein [Arcicella sp.]